MRAGRSKVAKEDSLQEVIESSSTSCTASAKPCVREAPICSTISRGAVGRSRHPLRAMFAEMARRERLFGLAEKVPKKHITANGRRKVVLLEAAASPAAAKPSFTLNQRPSSPRKRPSVL